MTTPTHDISESMSEKNNRADLERIYGVRLDTKQDWKAPANKLRVPVWVLKVPFDTWERIYGRINYDFRND